MKKWSLQLCLLVLALVHRASGEIDAGGGFTAFGTGFNHASVGSPFATAAEGTGVAAGVVEGFYPLDGDLDGVPDAWELRFFGVLNRSLTADDDGDGASNGMEYLAGTDPTDARSVLRASVGRSGGELVLSFPTVLGRWYRVLGGVDLARWNAIETVTGSGLSVERRYPMSAVAGGRYFFKVEPMTAVPASSGGVQVNP
jgi:hypothetical protein